MSDMQPTRRELLKKALYVIPAILTLAVAPSFASSGSGSGTQRLDHTLDENGSGGRDRAHRRGKGIVDKLLSWLLLS
jgi:hypothetical protein